MLDKGTGLGQKENIFRFEKDDNNHNDINNNDNDIVNRNDFLNDLWGVQLSAAKK